MRKRKTLRLSVDIGMTVLLFVLMAYQLTGQFAHEWAGAVMLVVFAAHHILNRQWFLSLGKGKYAPLRVIQTAADALLLADMLALMVSGIIMSHYVFAFLPPFGRISTARLLHLAASHWGFVLMGVHLGLHWGGMVGIVRGRLGWKPSRLRQVMLWIATAAVGAYGVYAFVTNQFGQYLFLQVEFAFFDFARPAYWFFLEHLAILWLFAGLAYATVRILQAIRKKRAAGR